MLNGELIGVSALDGALVGSKPLNGNMLRDALGGVSDYEKLKNKPQINGVELIGNKTTEELGIVSKETDPTVPQHVKNISESDINSWNNKSEFSGSYEDLTDKPQNLSEFNNDLGYLTSIPDEYITETELNNKGYATTGEVENATKDKATTSYVDQKIANLVNSAPETLDTLGEVAKVIQENADVVDALNNAIVNKADKTDLTDYVQKKDTALILYGTNANGVQTAWAFRNTNNTPNTVAGRDSNGNIQVRSAVNDSDAVNKKYLNEAISNKVGFYDFLSKEQYENGEIKELSTEPVYLRTSGGIYLTAAPDGSGRKVLRVVFANDTQVKGQKEAMPISTDQISLAVKTGLTANKLTLTDDEKAVAQSWLGIDTIVDNILDNIPKPQVIRVPKEA